MFSAHADETRFQYEILEARLEVIGGSSSAMKGDAGAQEERETAEKVRQHLPTAAREAFAQVVGIAPSSENYRRAS